MSGHRKIPMPAINTAASPLVIKGSDSAASASETNHSADESSSESEWQDPDESEESETESDGYSSEEALSDPERDEHDRSIGQSHRTEADGGPVRILVATADYEAEADGDLTFKQGDEFELLGNGLDVSFLQVRTLASPHVEGHVPVAFVREVGEVDLDNIPMDEVLHTIDSLIKTQQLPAGFRSSLLASLSRQPCHMLGDAVRPKLAAHGLALANLCYDTKRPASRLAAQAADVSVLFELTSAQNIPEPAAALGFTIVSRRARLVVMHHDREIVGSIVLVRGSEVSKPSSKWTFARGSTFSGGLNSDNVCLFRFNGDVAAHSLVVELSYVLQYRPIRPNNTEEMTTTPSQATADGTTPAVIVFEVSCGWTHIDLAVIPDLINKSHDQPLAGGTPIEIGTVDLKPVVAGEGRTQRGSNFLRRNGVGSTKTPIISFRFSAIKARAARLVNELPTTLFTQRSYVPLLSTFRGYLLDSFAKAGRTFEGGVSAAIYDPAAATFLELCSHPVMLASLRDRWKAECKSRARGSRRHSQHVLQSLLLQHVNLIVFTHSLSNPPIDDHDVVVPAALRGSKTAPHTMAAPPTPTPFNVQELVVDAWT
eukprot:m.193658 g.193658  ORF g.193658 m.193658 type:complete len:598 (+) comp24988_c0_seq1:71-1864(+)